MKRILITGATGFIGSHLTEFLVKLGFDVVAFDRYNSNNDWGWLENSKYKNDFQVILGDIRDYDSVSKAMADCDAVFHLAALIGIPYSYVSPLAYIRTNIEGTFNVLETAKNIGLEQILITSTSETYGSAQYVPIDEKHPLVGQSPYSASKIAADQLAISYYRSFNLPVKIVRPFNTYGPRQSARAIIPTIISQILNGKTEIKLGNLAPTRDLTFVTDTCAGFEEIYKSDSLFGEVTNIGMKAEISIGQLAKLIASKMDVELSIKSIDERIRPGKSEVERLFCDNTKLSEYTQWKPNYSLEKGIVQVIEWMKNFQIWIILRLIDIMYKIPLSVPSLNGNEMQYVKECIDSEWVSSAGKYVNLFEEKIAEFTGSKYAIACVNGTAAIQVSLRLAGVSPGDEVIVPTLTFIASVNAIKYNNAMPIFMDADNYYNIDSEKTIDFIKNETVYERGFTYNKKTNKKISAIIPVHVWGNACRLDELIDLCNKQNITIVEDAAESLGTFYNSGKFKRKNRHSWKVGLSFFQWE